MAESPFEPVRGDDDQQDVNWVPNEIDNTLKGGSAHPGSAGEPKAGHFGSGGEAVGSYAGAAAAQGFVGLRRVPDEDER